MKINAYVSNDGKISVFELSGRFDIYEASSVKAQFEELNGSPRQVVVDLEDVNFIDSTALAALVQGMKRCRQKKGDLHLCNLQPQVHVIFELTRLDKAFKIFASRAAAMAAFRR